MSSGRVFRTALLVTVGCPLLAFAVLQEFRWDGKGYDPGLRHRKTSAKFSIHPHRDFSKYDLQTRTFLIDPALVELWVDAKATVNEVGAIRLADLDSEARSQQCWKAMRHFSASWACMFKRAELRSLSGTGTIRVLDRSDRVLTEDPVDLDALAAFVKTLDGVN